MGDFNKVMVLGRLTRDPEVRYTPNGKPVCDIALAVGRKIGGGESGMERREETTYVDITLWNKQAELAGQYLSKGRELFVEGRLTLDSWEDRNTGQKRSKLKVVCENMQFVGSSGGGQQQQQRPQYSNNSQHQDSVPSQNQSYQAPPPQQPQKGLNEPVFEPEEDDDIPF